MSRQVIANDDPCSGRELRCSAVVKVLTIRDAKTGALIAQEQLRPKDDKDSVLTRIYRKAVGPEGPEFAILSRSRW
jgi:hypothetical protein